MTAATENEREARLADGRKIARVVFAPRTALDVHEADVCQGIWQWKGMYDNYVSERVPTTGWLWASSRGVKNVDHRLRRWGYVFWDRERLDGWGITQELMVNWPSTCHGKLIRQTQS